MPNSYTQLYIHYIFAVKYRAAQIMPSWQKRLHLYICAVFNNHHHQIIQINSMPDHLHILTSVNPSESVSFIIQQVKSESSRWINENRLSRSRFAWQSGYAAFSYSKSQLKTVSLYIENQQLHHKTHSFLSEYKQFLQSFEVDYNEDYLFVELL